MSALSEKKLERRCSDIARANGWYTRKFSSPSNRGVPDRIFIKDGDVVFVEFKAPGKTPTKLQIHELKEITDKGGNAVWCDRVDDFKQFLAILT
jgi:hypothetical protein